LFIGTEIRPDEQVPADQLLTLTLGNERHTFRRLKEGDRVEAGQLLGQLDDRLARDDLAIKTGKLAASKADLVASEKTRDEAKNRYDTQLKLQASSRGAAAAEDVRAAKLTWERFVYEAIAKREAVGLAELERSQAQTVLA